MKGIIFELPFFKKVRKITDDYTSHLGPLFHTLNHKQLKVHQ